MRGGSRNDWRGVLAGCRQPARGLPLDRYRSSATGTPLAALHRRPPATDRPRRVVRHRSSATGPPPPAARIR